MPTTTPAKISWHVQQLCKSINPNSTPVFVDVKVDEGSLANRCFGNVQASAREGTPVNGWTIWERAGAFIEAEAHCVLRQPDGKLLDISPKPDGENLILFLPDSELETPPDGGMAPPNRRLPLKKTDPVVRKWLKVADQQDRVTRGGAIPRNYEQWSIEAARAKRKFDEKYP